MGVVIVEYSELKNLYGLYDNEDYETRDFFIADSHFGDESIRIIDNRPFSSIKEMNDYMICKWNSVVGEADRVFVLGDFIVPNGEEKVPYKSILNLLNGFITLVVGNHDRSHLGLYRCNTNIEVVNYPIIYKGFYILSHEPMFVNMNMPYANIFGHIHDNPMYRTVSPRSYCVSASRLEYTPKDFVEIKKEILEEDKRWRKEKKLES